MLQNRVTPGGKIIRTEARGTLMGNRGVIHDADKNIVRVFKHKAWITCALQFKDRHREVMQPNRWTELFFLDEATAFATGHRPCCECRKQNFNHFKACWIRGNPQYGFEPKVSIREIDAVTHQERTGNKGGNLIFEEKADNLPDGTFELQDDNYFLLAGGIRYLWSPFGYGPGIPVSKNERITVVTPRSIVNAFNAGYKPEVFRR